MNPMDNICNNRAIRSRQFSFIAPKQKKEEIDFVLPLASGLAVKDVENGVLDDV